MTKKEVKNEVRRIINAARKHQRISGYRAGCQAMQAWHEVIEELWNKQMNPKKKMKRG